MHQPVPRVEGGREALLQVTLDFGVPSQAVQQSTERAAINLIEHVPSGLPVRDDVPALVHAPEAQQQCPELRLKELSRLRRDAVLGVQLVPIRHALKLDLQLRAAHRRYPLTGAGAVGPSSPIKRLGSRFASAPD